MSIGIVTDTSAGLREEDAKKLGIYVVPMPFYFDDKEYYEGVDDLSSFYELLDNAKDVKTSHPNFEKVGEVWDKALKENDEIIYLPLTSGLSGAYNAGCVLAQDDKYEGKVTVIDGRCVSVISYFEILDIKKMIDKGLDTKTIKEKVEANNKNQRIYICVDDLNYLVKGGRIDKNVATIGNILHIKPVLESDGGNFSIQVKLRVLSQAKDQIIKLLQKAKVELGDEDLGNYSVGTAYTDKKSDALVEDLNNNFKGLMYDIPVHELSAMISCHIGRGVVAAAIYKNIKI